MTVGVKCLVWPDGEVLYTRCLQNFQDSLSWQPNHEHLALDEKLSPNRLLYVADQLKEWAGPLLTAQGDRGDDLKIALEGAVRFLQGTAKQLGGPPAGHMTKVSNPKQKRADDETPGDSPKRTKFADKGFLYFSD